MKREAYFYDKNYRLTYKNSLLDLIKLPRTKFDRSFYKSTKEIQSLKEVKCGKRLRRNEFAKSTFGNPILWKSRKLHKGGYLKGQYKPKEKYLPFFLE